MSPVRNVSQEVEAIRNFGEFSFVGDRISGVDQLDRGFTIDREGDHLVVYVDCYGPEAGEDWNVDEWERCKLLLEVSGVGKASWDHAYRVARSLIAGRAVKLSDGRLVTRQAWAWEVSHVH